MNTRSLDLRKLNSLTKYPSILTYHSIDSKNGRLLDEVQVPLGYFDPSELVATEKVDGTNGRIVFLPDGMYIIGSREEFLYGKGDLIENPLERIVPALKSFADRVSMSSGAVTVFYAEVYGGNVGKSHKQYTSTRQLGFRVFDIAVFNLSEFEKYMQFQLEQFSGWREKGGQPFVGETALNYYAQQLNFTLTPRIPLYFGVPSTIEATYQYLQTTIGKSLCVLDEGAGGKPEGLVVRTKDRSSIAKIRFEDYERTLRAAKK